MNARVSFVSLVALMLACSVTVDDDDDPTGKKPPAADDGSTEGATTGEPPATTDASEGGETTDGSAPAVGDIALELVVDGLVAPTAFTVAPDGSLIVLDQPGIAYRIIEGQLHPFADLQDLVLPLEPDYDERGLLGIAFHPSYPNDARVFLYYSAPPREDAPEEIDHINMLVEYMVRDDGQVDPDSWRPLGAIDWPQANHNGGALAFGPDRMLYAALGDGGGAGDLGPGHPEFGNGQDWATPLGSILRIDPNPSGEVLPYTIPDDNPLTGDHPGLDEIWAYGLRNPWGMAFDPDTEELFVADAGQNVMEEINLVMAGDNLGWNVREGTTCFNAANHDAPLDSCPDTGPLGEPLVDPILTYAHAGSVIAEADDVHGHSVIGGMVYRGAALPDLYGVYVFGDFSREHDTGEGQLLIGRRSGDDWQLGVLTATGSEAHLGMFVRAFGQDLDGEIYVLTSERAGPSGQTGAVWRMVPSS